MAGIIRRNRPFAVTEGTAFAYVRCGMPAEWWAFADKHHHCYPSRATRNRWLLAQWNVVRSYARKHGYDVRRRFFDAEGDPWGERDDPLPLERRRQLARLFSTATRLGVGTVLVDDRRRLDEDGVVRSLLCRVFRAAGVRVIEACTGGELTSPEQIASGLGCDQRRLRAARNQVRSWKQLVEPGAVKKPPGRKPFGTLPGEADAIRRIRRLYRTLPPREWRRRGLLVVKRRPFQAIAAALNGAGVPTRTGRPWTGAVVFGILKRLKLWRPPDRPDRGR
jgi:hypothetical protein